MQQKIVHVDSKAFPVEVIFKDRYEVDFYQREYVWEHKQIEDLISDLTNEFLKNWKPGDTTQDTLRYAPYFMGEIVLAEKESGTFAVIDGQQRLTSFMLLMIFLRQRFGSVPGFPSSDLSNLIYANVRGDAVFKLDISERRECMLSLFNDGAYTLKSNDSISVRNLVERYQDIGNCWDDDINESNVNHFAYWLMGNITFSKVWTDSDELAYVIFETMNDRGLSLTQIEMLRSYLLSNIRPQDRNTAIKLYDDAIQSLLAVNTSAKSKLEFEFFKMYFRAQYAEDMSQGPGSTSDFVRIGKGFHRWVREEETSLHLTDSDSYLKFIRRLARYAEVFCKYHTILAARDTKEYLYLIVNGDYSFTLQPALILAAVGEDDTDETIIEKMKVISKYLTKVLTWRVWNHWMISQSSMEASIYNLCKAIRGMELNVLRDYLRSDPIELPELNNAPTLNQQNRNRLRVLLALITEIVASESGEPDYLLNKKEIEVEHIWSDHYEEHATECTDMSDFVGVRNNLGDLLLLPKSFNASYGDDTYEDKVVQYFSQNILAQTLNPLKYTNNPSFLAFKQRSGLAFQPYEHFLRANITERAELYKAILKWNWQ